MDWMKIGSAILLIAMAVFIFPRAMHAMKHGPKGSSQDWMSFIFVLAAIGGFIALLVMML